MNGSSNHNEVLAEHADAHVSVEAKKKLWPSPQDYNEAIQNPRYSLKDSVLREGTPELDQLGLPRPTSGGFASVYKLNCADGARAVRCFLHSVQDQQTRYQCISDALSMASLPYALDFEYQIEGIAIGSDWFPLVKMEWVSGLTLERYVEQFLDRPDEIKRLASRFKEMVCHMLTLGIAHGDLQHGNIIVTSAGELKLVDYDCMFVPAMEGQQSLELGHPNYQHPARNATHFGSYLDNFSSLVIYISLQILAMDPSLFTQLEGGNDCLLFRKQDFANPLESNIFHVLEKHRSREIRQLAKNLRWQIQKDPRAVLHLSEDLPAQLPKLPAVRAPVQRRKGDQSIVVHKDLRLEDGEVVLFSDTFKGTMAIPMLKLMLVVTSPLYFVHWMLPGISFASAVMTAILISIFVGYINGKYSSRWTKTVILTDRRFVELTKCRFYLNCIDEHDERIELLLDEVQSVELIRKKRGAALLFHMKDGYYFQPHLPWGMFSDGTFASLIGRRPGPRIKHSLARFDGATELIRYLPRRLVK